MNREVHNFKAANTVEFFNRFEDIISLTSDEKMRLRAFRQTEDKLNAEIGSCSRDAAKLEFQRQREKLLDSPLDPKALKFLKDEAASLQEIRSRFSSTKATLAEARRRHRVRHADLFARIAERIQAGLEEWLANYEADLRERCQLFELPYEPDTVCRGLAATIRQLGGFLRDLQSGGPVDVRNCLRGVCDLDSEIAKPDHVVVEEVGE